ncbi:hypothetical protein [Domibacillus robiginosus]|uniref:hypothetical protein n=1 Tax=Domibacillus robiginosus TaxID=1071054 RepID=UPI00067BD1E5|nr:hypothetical protein [Domibacillus robiginosus]
MTGLLRYHWSSYIRSHRYIPPLTLFILTLVVNYAYKPNPIIASYSFTALMLFLLMGWFTITIFHAEDMGQQQITLMHAKSQTLYHVSLIFVCLFIAFCLSVLSTAYPIVFDTFGASVSPIHGLLGFLAHFSLATLSISLCVLFTRGIVRKKENTWWGVLFVLVLSIAVVTLKKSILPEAFIWFMPPLHLSLDMMSVEDTITSIPSLFYWQFGWIFLYGAVVIGLFFILLRKKQAF